MVGILLFSDSFSCKVNTSKRERERERERELIFCGTSVQLVGTFVEVPCAGSC
jgi:hypothetical protein